MIDQFKVREEATQKLKAAGKEAIEPLATAALGASPEVTYRALDVLKELSVSTDLTTARASTAALRKLSTSNHKAATGATRALSYPQQKVIAELERAGATIGSDG